MYFNRFAQSVALLFSLVCFALPAQAQNNKPIVSGAWYEDRAFNSGSGIVFLSFAQAPTNKFLNITHVACIVVTSTGLVLGQVTLGGSSTNGASGDLGRGQEIRGNATVEIGSSGRYYSIVTESYLKLGPGRYPFIYFLGAQGATGSGNSISVDCTIVGNLSDN